MHVNIPPNGLVNGLGQCQRTCRGPDLLYVEPNNIILEDNTRILVATKILKTDLFLRVSETT